ncbi:hypothetical protein KHA80_03985 [Anaerobacillus sp. HL2]|nr:hypothetical protein KHA80_03985 [Anaerobacillus sp. HL2]
MKKKEKIIITKEDVFRLKGVKLNQFAYYLPQQSNWGNRVLQESRKISLNSAN